MNLIQIKPMQINTSKPSVRSEAAASLLPTGIKALAFLLLGLTLPLSGVSCQSTATRSPAELQGLGSGGVHILGPGDVIGITVPSAPEWNSSQTIRLDGKINLAKVGDVTASGKTLVGLQQELNSRNPFNLREDTEVKIVVSLVSTIAVVYVNGEVKSPAGKVSLSRPMTVYEVIMEAGGFSAGADAKKVTLTRQVDGAIRQFPLNLSSGGSDGTLQVKPFDTITVRQNWF
jgi:polysaccharide export outer membrane protein